MHTTHTLGYRATPHACPRPGRLVTVHPWTSAPLSACSTCSLGCRGQPATSELYQGCWYLSTPLRGAHSSDLPAPSQGSGRRRPSVNCASIWEAPLDEGEQSQAAIADWDPADDWADCADATR